MIFDLDFEQYVPVQHQLTEAYFAFRASENKDFDAADESETYRCYPLQKDGAISSHAPVSIPKAELKSILLLL